MKKFNFLLLFFVFSQIYCFGQSLDSPKFDSVEGRILYSEIVRTDTKITTNHLYGIIKEAILIVYDSIYSAYNYDRKIYSVINRHQNFDDQFINRNELFLIDNILLEKMFLRYSNYYINTSATEICEFMYNIKFEIKSGMYRYTISNFKDKYDSYMESHIDIVKNPNPESRIGGQSAVDNSFIAVKEFQKSTERFITSLIYRINRLIETESRW
jgi:hypothetical protein